MVVFWISECLPLAITSLLPLVLLPLAGVLGTKEVKSLMRRMLYFFVLYFVFAKVSIHYLGATNMMFVAGLMMAVAVEHCGLHHRFPIIIAVIDICHRHHHHYDLAFAMVQELEQCGC